MELHNNNQQFLQYDNGQNAENRMLVFYSPESLERLANAQTFFIFMDGTLDIEM
jgi:NurA-like 5'-3' nuclease